MPRPVYALPCLALPCPTRSMSLLADLAMYPSHLSRRCPLFHASPPPRRALVPPCPTAPWPLPPVPVPPARCPLPHCHLPHCPLALSPFPFDPLPPAPCHLPHCPLAPCSLPHCHLPLFPFPPATHKPHQPPLLDGEGPIGLVMAPARELANQIYSEAKKFAKVLYSATLLAC